MYYVPQYFSTSLNVGGGIDATQTTGIVLQSVTGLDITKPGIACLSYSDPVVTSTAEWITFTSINGSNELQGVTRAAEGFSGKTHANGATIAFPLSKSHINKLNDMFVTGGDGFTQIATPANPASGYNKLYFKSDDKLYKLDSAGTEAEVGAGGGASFWTTFSGAYASGTTLTVAGVDMTGIFKKGVVLKWLSSADAFKTGMVVSSSFSTDTTITIIGSTAASGDKTFYYGGDALIHRFIIPGTLSAGTGVHFWRPSTPIYPLGDDSFVTTAGTTNASEIDINDDGTSLFNGTAASIASGATSDTNNAAYTPTTVVAAESLITVDINSVSTTAPVEGDIYFYYFPQWWVSRT